MPAPKSSYVADTLALLADSDPLVVLAETPAWLAAQRRGTVRRRHCTSRRAPASGR